MGRWIFLKRNMVTVTLFAQKELDHQKKNSKEQRYRGTFQLVYSKYHASTTSDNEILSQQVLQRIPRLTMQELVFFSISIRETR